MGGAKGISQYANYGALGVPQASNIPGGRGAAGFYHHRINEEVWVFGGSGLTALTTTPVGTLRFQFLFPMTAE